MGKKSVITIICALLIVFPIGGLPAMAAEGPDHYKATTADGVKLGMKRYRPDSTARFRKGAQPIIMMSAFSVNINEFDVRTPEGENYNVKLPSPLAPWARGDKYIQKDHMRYFSLAHYLWLQGYDVWMANYRVMGRTPDRSNGGGNYSIDDLGIYDVPAVVQKVYKITRKHPLWVAHSMGATMAYIYLQGAKYGPGCNPHVVSDPALVKKRNGGNSPESIKAFVDLDGPMVTFNGQALDDGLVWTALALPWFLEMRPLMIMLGDSLGDPIVSLMAMMWYIYKALGMPDMGALNILLCMNKDNLDPNVVRFAAKYVFDGFGTRVMAQFCDASAHGVFREDYTNGKYCIIPPDPYPGDGYYYYSNNLSKIKLPALVLADDRVDLTNPADIKKFYLNKTRNRLDVFIRVANTAHADLVCGLNCPTFTFPTIGRWLKKACK